MEYVQGIRSVVSDTFLTLPLILIGFMFFLGTLTSNSGLLYLFAGHLFVVPSLEFFANERGPAWFEEGQFSLAKLIKWFLSTLIVLGVNIQGTNASGLYFFLLLIPLIGQFVINRDVSPMFFLANPVAWFTSSNPEGASASCAMVPGADDSKKVYNSPSLWLSHIVFFFGFFFANAAAIYNQPIPTITNPTPEQKAQLDTRVANRKAFTVWAMFSAAAVLSILLIFRYMKTGCESDFLYNLFPLAIIGFTGASWFQVLLQWCGVRPADILGIVQGFISPNSIDKPIVCIGS